MMDILEKKLLHFYKELANMCLFNPGSLILVLLTQLYIFKLCDVHLS